MSAARDTILNALRRQRSAPEPKLPPLASSPATPHADWAQFEILAQAASARVLMLAEGEPVHEVLERLMIVDPAAQWVAAPHPWCVSLAEQHQGRLTRRAFTPIDSTYLTVARCAVAETGSVVLVDDVHTPAAPHFLAEHLICLIARDALAGNLEQAWARLRSDSGLLPSAVHLVTGPSRTADVEQTLQLGAHGPRQLSLLVTDRPSA